MECAVGVKRYRFFFNLSNLPSEVILDAVCVVICPQSG